MPQYTTLQRAEILRVVMAIALLSLTGRWLNAIIDLGEEGASASTLGGVVMTPIFAAFFIFGFVQSHRLMKDLRGPASPAAERL